MRRIIEWSYCINMIAINKWLDDYPHRISIILGERTFFVNGKISLLPKESILFWFFSCSRSPTVTSTKAVASGSPVWLPRAMLVVVVVSATQMQTLGVARMATLLLPRPVPWQPARTLNHRWSDTPRDPRRPPPQPRPQLPQLLHLVPPGSPLCSPHSPSTGLGILCLVYPFDPIPCGDTVSHPFLSSPRPIQGLNRTVNIFCSFSSGLGWARIHPNSLHDEAKILTSRGGGGGGCVLRDWPGHWCLGFKSRRFNTPDPAVRAVDPIGRNILETCHAWNSSLIRRWLNSEG